MNRRQRRANGHRGPRTQHLARAVACPDCGSTVTLSKVAARVYSGMVEHDDTCPWYQAFQRRGGHGVRLATKDPLPPEGEDE